jgi:signal transduction histidine kinase/ActR/RegA family two-component response regulator
MVEASLVKATNNGNSAREWTARETVGLSVQELAPHAGWGEMNGSDHFVQFYETDEFLVDSLGGYIGAGLMGDESCIVVATDAHREALEERLQADGLNVAASRARGQYVSLDAAETLAKLLVDEEPEPGRFHEIIGDIVTCASAGGRKGVRIFGEMVALLWAEGRYDSAIRLEELWNDLRKTHSFQLLCGYPMDKLGGAALAEPLHHVCVGHSRVIPSESYTALSDGDARLRAITLLQQKARSLEAEIAERREAEDALRAVKGELELQLVREQAARAEAEAANRLKDEFLATVSHELRTPLHAIIGWSHMLRQRRLDEATVTRALETIERNAQSQAQLIEDILDVSRVITGKLRLNVAHVDVAAVVNAAIDSVQLAAESKGIQLEVTLDPRARHVSGDASRLQQVVWNLLSNAIKFTPAGGRVSIRLERANSNVQIRVSDTGCGVSRDFLPFIFDRFRQADGTSTRMHGGLGLGLAIVRHLVELHGGTVHADSDGEGRGATFTISLPLLAPTVEHAKSNGRETMSLWSSEEPNPYDKPLLALDGVRVLLVDDDRDSLQILTVMLTEHRASVEAVSSVAEALETLEWYKPDVLVSDLAMPGEDGYSLIHKVRALEAANGQQTPAVALTAYVRVEDRARALKAGFNMFVPKPVEPNDLILAIANLAGPGAAKI